MTGRALTFDFHNTLARCDGWFELEVRQLPAAFLRWRAAGTGGEADPRLLDAATAAYRRLRDGVTRDGREVTAEAGVARVLAELGLPSDAAAVAEGVETLMRATLDEATPIPGAVGTVRAVAETGTPLGVVSSAVYPPFLEWALERFGIRDVFADVTTSAGAGFYKSNPEIYRRALAALGATAERSVHVGDSYRYDVAGARRAGLKTVWLRTDSARLPEEGPPPDLTIASLDGSAPAILALLA
jgi:putative hydrolase of the HAD superfamily